MVSPKQMLKRIPGVVPLVWANHARLMRKRIAEFDSEVPVDPEGERILVVVAPWDTTTVPWFTIALGLMLAGRGARVTFVVDDMPFGSRPKMYSTVLRAIRFVMRTLTHRFKVLHLSQVDPIEEPSAAAAIDRLAKLNAVWELRGERITEGRAEVEARNRAALRPAYGRIANLLSQLEFDVLFTPGGIYGGSGIWVEQAKAHGLRIVSYDNGGFGTWMTAVDGLACHLGDIPRTVRMFSSTLADSDREAALGIAREELSKRWAGTDIFKYQVGGAAGGDERAAGGIMLALNSSWDSAALGIHEVFESNQQWIVETVRHLLDNTDVPVIVRQHPAERFDFAKTTDDYGALLTEHFGNNPRLWFIAAADPVNSYSLMTQVAAVVVHSSTIGNEAAAMGRVVITTSRSYYAGLGFVWQCVSLDQYREHLNAAAAGRLEVTDAMREDAHLCYYSAQVCNWVHSLFNPESFASWSAQRLDYWYAETATGRALDAMIGDVPVSVLNHYARNSA